MIVKKIVEKLVTEWRNLANLNDTDLRGRLESLIREVEKQHFDGATHKPALAAVPPPAPKEEPKVLGLPAGALAAEIKGETPTPTAPAPSSVPPLPPLGAEPSPQEDSTKAAHAAATSAEKTVLTEGQTPAPETPVDPSPAPVDQAPAPAAE